MRGLRANQTLTSLDLSHHGVRNAGCAALAQALPWCSVADLRLRFNYVDARGALGLAGMLGALSEPPDEAHRPAGVNFRVGEEAERAGLGGLGERRHGHADGPGGAGERPELSRQQLEAWKHRVVRIDLRNNAIDAEGRRALASACLCSAEFDFVRLEPPMQAGVHVALSPLPEHELAPQAPM